MGNSVPKIRNVQLDEVEFGTVINIQGKIKNAKEALNVFVEDQHVGVILECFILSSDILEYGDKFELKITLQETQFQFQINGKDYFTMEHHFEEFAPELSVTAQGCKIYAIQNDKVAI